jgi:cell division transport system permease protein
MRLVGASNFYIQLPFILEGAIAGLIGAAIALGALAAMVNFVVLDRLAVNFPVTQYIGWDAVWATAPWLFLVGVVLSALASFVTLRKYLRV